MSVERFRRLALRLTALESAVAEGGPGGTSDHGALTGLADDDHSQYHNDARGDARYSQLGHTHSYEAAGAVAAHEAAGDPHPGYLTTAEGNAAYDAIGAATAAQAAAVQRANHTGTQAASTISDFNSASRAQTEAALVAGSGITLTPASSGATRTITIAATGGGSDPWTYLRLTSDFTTTSATAVDVTGLAFTPAANGLYEFEGTLLVRTATATVGPRPGIAWPTGMTDGIGDVQVTSSVSAMVRAIGSTGAAILAPVGGLPNTTASFPAWVSGYAIAGASPSGNIRIQLASETAGTTVTVKAGSFLRYRAVP